MEIDGLLQRVIQSKNLTKVTWIVLHLSLTTEGVQPTSPDGEGA